MLDVPADQSWHERGIGILFLSKQLIPVIDQQIDGSECCDKERTPQEGVVVITGVGRITLL